MVNLVERMSLLNTCEPTLIASAGCGSPGCFSDSRLKHIASERGELRERVNIGKSREEQSL
jgi:hypothetical protein